MELTEQTREDYYREYYEEIFSEFLTTKYVHTNKGHMSRKYPTPDKLAKVAVKYFTDCAVHNRPISVTGFLIKSKIVYRHVFDDYKNYDTDNEKGDFKRLVSLIKLIIEDYNVEQLYSMSHNGARFILQCAFKNYVPKEHQIIEQVDFKVNVNKSTVTQDDEDDN